MPQTVDLDDKYLGSGKLLRRAIEKYGIENFEREILHVFDNPTEMFAKEAEIVTEDFLSEENCYNLKLGGEGGFDFISKEVMSKRNKKITANRDYSEPSWRKKVSDAVRKADSEGRRRIVNNYPNWNGRTHSEISKTKISEKAKQRVGSLNSQYGTMWITDGIHNKKIKKGENIPDGFSPGRI